MSRQSEGAHHYSVRKRIYRKHEPFPHPKPLKRIVDRLAYVIGFIGPIMTIPQLRNIWIDHNASGVAPLSWAAYAFVACFWMVYGLAHRERPLVLVSMA